MKKFLAIILAAVMTLSLVSCSSGNKNNVSGSASAASQSKKLKIGFIFYNLADVSLTAIKQDAQAECKAQNIDFTAVDGAGDSATQITAIENMITSGMNAIAIQAVDNAAVTPYLKKAQAAGIKIFAFGIETGTYDLWYRNDPNEVGGSVGKAAGDWITKNLSGKANVAVLNFPSVPTMKLRGDAMVSELMKAAPDCKVVATSAALDTETALNTVENMLQKHPEINVVVSLSDGAGLGAVQAFKAAKKDPKACAVFGSDISKLGAQAIVEGGFYKGSVDVSSLTLGKNTIDMCVQLINGEKLDKVVYMKVTPVDSSNAAQFAK